MKTPLLLTLAAVCLALAGIVLYRQHAGRDPGLDSIPPASRVWLRCRHCGHSWEIGERDLIEQQRAALAARPGSLAPPALPCPECGRPSAVPAERCAECNEVFIPSPLDGDYPDRCPRCGTSAMEKSRREPGAVTDQ